LITDLSEGGQNVAEKAFAERNPASESGFYTTLASIKLHTLQICMFPHRVNLTLSKLAENGKCTHVYVFDELIVTFRATLCRITQLLPFYVQEEIDL
jgi:hypothetical protein